jgi:SPX domain protein involved in polyphosphate accumulation
MKFFPLKIHFVEDEEICYVDIEKTHIFVFISGSYGLRNKFNTCMVRHRESANDNDSLEISFHKFTPSITLSQTQPISRSYFKGSFQASPKRITT